ncbi:hypothetical protein Q3G72_021409 [Acer saccharum]|nr:hypothetical protein Q3G72_021409 [Acer saccharum]
MMKKPVGLDWFFVFLIFTEVGTNFVQGSSRFSFLVNTQDLEPSQYVTGATMTAIQLVVTATARNSHLCARYAAEMKGYELQNSGYFLNACRPPIIFTARLK